MFNEKLSNLNISFDQYTELRLQVNRSKAIAMSEGNIVENTENETKGISARTFDGLGFGFHSSGEFDLDEVKKIIDRSNLNARTLGKLKKGSAHILPKSFGTKNIDLSTKKERYSKERLIAILKEIDSFVVSSCPKILSRTVAFRSLDMQKNLLTSEGSESFSLIPRDVLFIQLTMESRNNGPVSLMDFVCKGKNLEDYYDLDSVKEKITSLYRHLENKADGVFTVAGKKECILDSNLAGILAHEAIGHTTEADIVLAGSVAGDSIGKKVASDLISMSDYAHTAFGQTLDVPIFVDDEGVEAKDVHIIEDGILKNFMHNKDTARQFGVGPTGNARAYLYKDEPLVRMRNTFINPGKSKLEDMIESIEDGYYLIKSGNGQADTTSEFMFGVPLGYEIKKGKIGKAIFDTTISGIAFDLLKTVSMVSDELTINAAGMCGKKQPIPVSMGGPAIKCELNIGGR